jgi:hypothetical protein
MQCFAWIQAAEPFVPCGAQDSMELPLSLCFLHCCACSASSNLVCRTAHICLHPCVRHCPLQCCGQGLAATWWCHVVRGRCLHPGAWGQFLQCMHRSLGSYTCFGMCWAEQHGAAFSFVSGTVACSAMHRVRAAEMVFPIVRTKHGSVFIFLGLFPAFICMGLQAVVLLCPMARLSAWRCLHPCA